MLWGRPGTGKSVLEHEQTTYLLNRPEGNYLKAWFRFPMGMMMAPYMSDLLSWQCLAMYTDLRLSSSSRWDISRMSSSLKILFSRMRVSTASRAFVHWWSSNFLKNLKLMYGVSTKASPNAFFFTRNIHVDHDVLDLTRRQKLEPLALPDQVPHQRFAHLSNVVRTFASPLSEFMCIYPFMSPIGFHKEENVCRMHDLK